MVLPGISADSAIVRKISSGRTFCALPILIKRRTIPGAAPVLPKLGLSSSTTNFSLKPSWANFNHINVDVLSLCIVIFLIYIFLITPYQAIDNEKNIELKSIVLSIKGTEIDPIFNSQLKDFMSDGKLSNKEFNKLKDLFNTYQTSIISGSQDKFIKLQSTSLQADNESNENNQNIAIFFMISFMLIVTGIGLRKVIND